MIPYMPKALLVAGFILIAGCSRELPTEPQQSKTSAPISVDARAGGRRRAVAPGGQCVDLSGVWDVRYQGSCRTDIYMTVWTFAQSGCNVHTPFAADIPIVSGAVSGNSVELAMRNGFTVCQYQLDGAGQVTNGVITATVSGPVSGCCDATSETLHIVATKRPQS
jgi:hypothetical protein